jgi:hypothetical protein
VTATVTQDTVLVSLCLLGVMFACPAHVARQSG